MDIDADFCIYEGDKVFDYLNNKYGKNHCCNIITFQRLQTKAIIKDLARALEVDFSEVNRFTASIPDKIDDKDVHLKDLIDNPQFSWFFNKYPVIKKHALKLEGLPKSTSQHPAGIGVVPCEITDLVPVIPAKETASGMKTYLSSFEKEQTEQMGVNKTAPVKVGYMLKTA
jgi:DNA polymerase-3 subunit alpha